MKKRAILTAAIVLPLVPVAEWVAGLVRDVGELAATPGANIPATLALIYYPARIFALVGFTLMFYQFLLSAKLPVLEAVFKRADLIKRHRSLGKLGFLLILLHGLAMMAFDLIDHGVIIFTVGKLLGMAALFLLIMGVIAAWHFKALQFNLKTWKRLHLAAYAVFPLAFIHAILIGSVAGEFGATQVLFSVFLAAYAYVAIRRIVVAAAERRRADPSP